GDDRVSLGEPIYRYKPSKVRDGHGGWTETAITPITIYGVIEVHENATSVILDIDADVKVGDLLRLRLN
ncbi:hypothetical protein LCGC14_2480420, partial [marine sediment metagenome]